MTNTTTATATMRPTWSHQPVWSSLGGLPKHRPVTATSAATAGTTCASTDDDAHSALEALEALVQRQRLQVRSAVLSSYTQSILQLLSRGVFSAAPVHASCQPSQCSTVQAVRGCLLSKGAQTQEQVPEESMAAHRDDSQRRDQKLLQETRGTQTLDMQANTLAAMPNNETQWCTSTPLHTPLPSTTKTVQSTNPSVWRPIAAAHPSTQPVVQPEAAPVPPRAPVDGAAPTDQAPSTEHALLPSHGLVLPFGRVRIETVPDDEPMQPTLLLPTSSTRTLLSAPPLTPLPTGHAPKTLAPRHVALLQAKVEVEDGTVEDGTVEDVPCNRELAACW